jgi:predicted PurR-regulated permease PerM
MNEEQVDVTPSNDSSKIRDSISQYDPHTLLEKRSFLFLLSLITLLFFYLLKPFFTPVFWAVVVGVLFHPLHLRLLQKWQRPNLCALITLAVCVILAIVPVLFLSNSFFQQGTAIFERIQNGDIKPAQFVDRIRDGIPIVEDLLKRFHIDIAVIKQYFSSASITISRFLAQNAVNIGQNMVQFFFSLCLMLYLAFFILRDGPDLVRVLIQALPLGDAREQMLFGKFVEVTRATVKGNLLVAIAQGSLGGLTFWILDISGAVLWGVVMTVLSLVPVVGAGLIWGPVAIYLLATGEWERGLVLSLIGVGAIGLIDNILRPILVGRDTKLPDFLVLLSTLGGFVLFGMNGFVIGPLLAVLFITFWQIFILEFNAPPRPEGDSELICSKENPKETIKNP